jgi:S-adenosylmethionine synthetase
VEIVERKGTGHPDSICDALAEAASLALCRLYRERFGMILHHNVDKVLLWGGEAQPAWGGGRVIQPIEIFIAGRATRRFQGVDIPVEESIAAACRAWLRGHLANLDAERHVKLHILLRPSLAELANLFPKSRAAGSILANDTSCGVGYAPLSPLERAVHGVERYLTEPSMKAAHPELGEDIKVMGVACRGETRLTVAIAFVGAYVANADDYFAKKADIRDLLAAAVAGGALGQRASVELNTADVAPDSLYVTVTGLSAEAGDDGEAGRGNRSNGLITPYRPMTMESIAGKNPVNHVGKLYNLAAGLIADDLVREIDEVEAAECYLVSQIGRPIDEPQIVEVRLGLASGGSLAALRPRVRDIVAANLGRLDRFAGELLDGRLGFDRWPLRRPAAGMAGGA